MKGLIIYQTYEIIDNETYIQLFGRLENGQSFATLSKFNPYFMIRKKDLKKISDHLQNHEPRETNLKNFENEELVKLVFTSKSLMDEVYKKIYKEVQTYEADIKPHQRFLIDHDLLSTIKIEGDYETSEKVDRVYREPKLTPADFSPKIKVISLDIESDKKGNLYCVGLTSENYRKNFMITKHELLHTVSCKDEEDCLEKFKMELIKLDPDLIIGWNVIDFDFVYLKELFKKHKIEFDLGRTLDSARLRIEKNFFRSSSMDLPGRQVLDGLNLIKDPFIKEAPSIKAAKFESYSLEDVSQELIGKGKLLKGKGRHEEIEALYKTNTKKSHQALVDYNLNDCEIVYEMLDKTKMIDLAIERSQITGMTLDRLTSSIAAFDSLYIREARKKNLASPTLNFKNKESRIKGGYVQSSGAGVYKNVLIFDFKSLYPSIIRTFNIDPASYVEKKEKGVIEAPNGAFFKNQDGLLPEIISKLHEKREIAKKEKRELSNHAIKTIMNSFFGVLASPNCRYFNLKMANAITHFGQFLIKLTAKQIEKTGYKAIYSDTDSVFIETKLEKSKANASGKKIEEDINSFYRKYIREKYSRDSFLELQFAKQYIYLMIPKTRDTEAAAKKRYAGLIEKNGKEELEITGLEAIRGDWTEAAQEFQKQLLWKLFHDEPIEKFIREFIKNIRDGKFDSKLIYRKSIRKSLDEYTKTTPPHVKAARKLDSLEGNIISYYITEDGPEPTQKLKHKIDYEHYIDKQIKPIAEQVLSVFNKEFKDVTGKSTQSKLF